MHRWSESIVARHFFAALLLVLIAACGGNGGSSGGPLSLGGKAVLGPISGATVTVYSVAGSSEGIALGSGVTGSDGSYSVEIESYSGPVIVKVVGGSYTEESSGTTVVLASNDVLRCLVPNASGSVTANVTPLTEIAAALAQASGGFDRTNVAQANNQVGAFFGGIDIVGETPLDPTTASTGSPTQPQIDYGLILAGISEMAEGLSVTSKKLTDALARDLSDGTFDGVDGEGAVPVGGGTLAATAATTDLASSIDAFEASSENVAGAVSSEALNTGLVISDGSLPNAQESDLVATWNLVQLYAETEEGSTNAQDEGGVDHGTAIFNAGGTVSWSVAGWYEDSGGTPFFESESEVGSYTITSGGAGTTRTVDDDGSTETSFRLSQDRTTLIAVNPMVLGQTAPAERTIVIAIKAPSNVPTVSDLSGSYFFAGIGMEAAREWRSELGTVTFDGVGGISGTWNSVQSGAGGEIFTNASLTGSYSFDGNGLLTLTLNLNGSAYIRYLGRCGDGLNSIVYMLPNDQEGEHPRFGMLVRKPSAATNNATIQGNYHFANIARDYDGTAQELESGIGTLSFDGAGNYTWSTVGHSSLSSLVETDEESGTYRVNSDGTFTLTESDSIDPDVLGRIQQGGGTLLLSMTDPTGTGEHLLGIAIRK